MGMFDNLGGALKGMAGQLEAAALPLILSEVLAKTDLGSIQGLLNKLQQHGLSPQIASWLSDGKNIPITADQLRSAIGNEQVEQIGKALGIPMDKVLTFLADHLPEIVDKLSPHGTLQPAK